MRNQTLQLPPKFFTTWGVLSVLDDAAIVLKQEPPLSRYVTEISTATGEYEKRLRKLWEDFKKNPTRDAAKRLATQMKAASAEYWPEAVASVLGVGTEDLIPKQRRMVEDALDEHHNFIDKSLLPDILRVFDRGGVFEADDFNIFDHRMIFMYAGALWSLGFLATITYDGLNVRDLADVFVMLGPDDERTCTGPRGCHKFVNKFFTVAQIIADDIIPGHFKCLTNCRHIMLPVASPLTKRKHQPGKHPQKRHAGSRGQGAAGIADLVKRTAAINEGRGVEDQDIYVDKDAKSVSSAKSPEVLRQELGGPIRVNEAFGKPPISAHQVDRSLFDHLEGKAKSGEGLQEVLDREIRTAAITRVPLDKVNLVQKYVFEKPLQKAVESKSYKKSDDLYLLKIKGQFFVHNGNHRVGAAKLNNEDALDFKVIPVDLTSQKEHTPIWVDKVLKHQLGKHPQESHGRRGAAISLRIEDTTIAVRGDKHGLPDGQYHSVATHGVRKTALNKAKKLSVEGKDFRAVRANGTYHVIEYKPPKSPVKAPPKPVKRKSKPLDNPPAVLSRDQSALSLSDQFLVTSNASTKEQKAIQEEVLGKIPKWHLDTGAPEARYNNLGSRLEFINWVKGRSVDKEYTRVTGKKARGTVGFAVTAGKSAGIIAVADKIPKLAGGAKSTLAHEIGHQVFQRNITSITALKHKKRIRKTETRMHNLYNERAKSNWWNKAVTTYATTSNREFVAETYGYMVSDPKLLLHRDPEAYGIMLGMFGETKTKSLYDLIAQKEHTPILALDFDGTLSDYKGGWQGIDVINANPSPGAQEFVKQALTKFDVHVFSSRSKDPVGIKAMQAWTRKHNFPVGMKFVTNKPAAHVTLDDRAITFEGKWPSVQSLLGFQSWVNKVLKHLLDQHDQASHGRRGAGRVVVSETRLEGKSKPRLVEYADGTKAVVKNWDDDLDPVADAHRNDPDFESYFENSLWHGPIETSTNELVAAQTSKILGLDVVPETVEVGNKQGTAQKYVPGVKYGADMSEAEKTALYKTEAAMKLTVLDYVTEQVDRHPGNWGTDTNGKLWAFDNGVAAPSNFASSIERGQLFPFARPTVRNFKASGVPKSIMKRLESVTEKDLFQGYSKVTSPEKARKLAEKHMGKIDLLFEESLEDLADFGLF